MLLSQVLIALNIYDHGCNLLSFVTLLPIWMLVKGESESLCISHGVPVLAPQVEICSDMQTMFTCTGLDSCAPIPSVLSDSWVQAISMCYHSANPKIINQLTWFCRFWTGAGLYPASSDLKWASHGICLCGYACTVTQDFVQLCIPRMYIFDITFAFFPSVVEFRGQR